MSEPEVEVPNEDLIKELEQLKSLLKSPGDKSFADSLIYQFGKKKFLSTPQWKYVRILIKRALGGKVDA